MNKTTIFYKTKNILIEKLEKQSNIEVLKERNFFAKIFSAKKIPDIYFHSGSLDDDSKENILNSKITIVNSFAAMNEIIARTKISHEKIKVIYPSIEVEYKDPEQIKAKICEELQIHNESRTIFFSAKKKKY